MYIHHSDCLKCFLQVEIQSYCHFNISNLNHIRYNFQCIFFTQVCALCNSSSTMNFFLVVISVVMAFTSALVNGLSCALGTELECVYETKCEIAYLADGIPTERCVPQQVCDCVWKSTGSGFLLNTRPVGENLFL